MKGDSNGWKSVSLNPRGRCATAGMRPTKTAPSASKRAAVLGVSAWALSTCTALLACDRCSGRYGHAGVVGVLERKVRLTRGPAEIWWAASGSSACRYRN
eukprot:COSAG01_NODE_2223_length_8136_cov_10.727917_11_plen_100_part_00